MLLDGFNAEHVQRAAQALAAGELIGLPTETVYGLGARAEDDIAVARIFEMKGRPANHPLIVHVLDVEDAARFAGELSPVAKRLMAALWPGPLTLIVARASGRAEAAAGGHATVGIRCPAHPVARAVLAAARSLGVLGVAAPSANRFGRVSPTSAQHVVSEFGSELLVLDGGECEVGIESSIVDCSRGEPVLLRPGVLARAEIEAAAGARLRAPDAEAPSASGTLPAHYAPRARVRIFSTLALLEYWNSASRAGVGVYARTPMSVPAATDFLAASALPEAAMGATEKGAVVRRMPDEARAAAHELFAALRAFDDAGVHEVWIEAPPLEDEWEGVRDRLTRAAAAFPSE